MIRRWVPVAKWLVLAVFFEEGGSLLAQLADSGFLVAESEPVKSKLNGCV
jgi:hypothetical protein